MDRTLMLSIKNIVMKYPRKLRKFLRDMSFKKKYGFHKSGSIDANRVTILLVSHSSLRGGAPLLLANIAQQLKNDGLQVVLISKDYGDMMPAFKKNSDYFEVCTTLKSAELLIKQLAGLNIVGCICNSVMSSDYIKVVKKYGIREITLVHEMKAAIETLNAKKFANEAAVLSDAIVFPSKYVEKSFSKVCQITVPIRIRPQGLYLTGNTKEIDTTALESNHIDVKNGHTILNVASSSKRKGFDIFCDLAAIMPDDCFIWVGFEDNRFTREVLRKGKPENLHLIGYIAEPEQLFALYSCATLFVLTSREEPFGSVVLEAFSWGIPVVAIDGCGGFVDVIKNRDTGRLAKAVTAQAIKSEIESLIADSDLDQIRKNCAKLANTMSFEKYVEYIVQVLKE